MKTTKRLFSLFLLLAMVASLFSGVAYASEEFDAPDVMEPVTEEVTEDPVPEEVTEEEAPLTSGDEALVPVEEEAPAVEEAPVSDALPEEAEEATEEEEAPAEDGAVTIVMTAGELTTAVANGGEIQLGADIELTKKLEVPYTCTIDLNGHELYQDNSAPISNKSWVIAIEVKNKANLTVTDSSEGKMGKIWARNDDNSNMAGIYNSSDGIVTVNGGTVAGSTLPPDEDEAYDDLECDGIAYGIYNEKTGTVVVNGGTVKGKAVKRPSYGIYSGSGGSVEVKSGTISARSNVSVVYAVYMPLSSECIITGGSFTCSGGGTGSDYDVYVNGATLNIDKYTGAKLTIMVQGEKAKVTGDMTKVDKATSVVKGGVFSDAGVADIVSAGYEVVDSGDANFPYKVQQVIYTLVLQEGKVYKSEDLGSTLGEPQTVTGITCSGSAQDGYTYTFTNLDFATAATTAVMVKDTAATVTLVGNSTIEGGNSKPDAKANRTGLSLAGSLTINGSGTLTVTSGKANKNYASRGIYFNASDTALSIDGGAAVVAAGTSLTTGTYVAYGIAGENNIANIALTVNDGSLTATGVTQAIYGTTTVNGKATAGADAANAVDVTSVGTEKYVHIEPKPMAASVTIDSTTTKYETLAEAWSAAQTAGTATVKLLANVTGNVTNASGKVITLDLNGYVLQGDSTSSVITNNGTLTIEDSNPNAEHKFVTTTSPWVWNEDSGGTVVKGGCITGGIGTIVDSATCGGGVYNTGTLFLVGGSIIGNTVNRYGGGVYNKGTFDMSGGSITGNKSNYTGGGVNNGNTFNMSGGSITDNTANKGGGVDNGGTFNMSGGSIAGNTASDGFGGGVNNNDGRNFNMSGGSITGNTAQNCGGGVYDEGKLSLVGGSITGNTATTGGGVFPREQSPTIGGTVKITGNTNGNLYIPSVMFGDPMKVAIGTDANAPAAGMSVGVTMGGGTGKFTSNGTANDLLYFSSDNTAYAVKYNTSGCLELVATPITGLTYAANLTLSESIAVNIYIKDTTEVDKFTVTADGTTLTGTAETDCIRYTMEDLNAAELGNSVHYVVSYTDNTGTYQIKSFDYSAENYCDNMIANHPDKTKLCNLCDAVLLYGAAAQEYKNEENTLYTDSDYQTKLNAQVTALTEETALSPAEGYTVGYGMSLDSKLNMKLTLTGGTGVGSFSTDDKVMVGFTSGENGYYLKGVTVTDETEKSSVTVAGIQPTQMDTTLTLYYRAAGDVKNHAGSATGLVTFSANQYLKAIYGSTDNQTLQNLCLALYNYGVMAKAYTA